MKKGFLLFMVLAFLIIAVPYAWPQANLTGATYVGSAKCKECHDRIYAQWRKTQHARVIEDVRKNPQALQGDFTTPDPIRTFGKKDVAYRHGTQWKQRYITKDWKILPAQWNFDTQKWATFTVATTDWKRGCAGCHTTGFNRSKLTWKELNVGCEACHGPGSKHAEKPTEEGNIVDPTSLPVNIAAAICGQCHTRGTSPDGKWSHPVNYRPGDDLSAKNFKPVPKSDDKAWWPDGSVKQHRQQYIEWKESGHFRAGVWCVTCHEPHRATNKFQTKLSQNSLCIGCHSAISSDSVNGHAPVGGTLRQHSSCVGCHMSRTGKSAEAGDEVSHRFKFIAPIATIQLGGGDTKNQPNSCSLCHPGAPVQALHEDFAERLQFRALRP